MRQNVPESARRKVYEKTGIESGLSREEYNKRWRELRPERRREHVRRYGMERRAGRVGGGGTKLTLTHLLKRVERLEEVVRGLQGVGFDDNLENTAQKGPESEIITG